MYIDCIAISQLLCWVKDMWYSAHPNHLISQRVVFLYYLFSQKRQIKTTSKRTLGTNYSLQTVLKVNLQHPSPSLLCLNKLLAYIKVRFNVGDLLQCTSVNSNLPRSHRNLVKVVIGNEQSINSSKLVPIIALKKDKKCSNWTSNHLKHL